ncbi:uncharacterized protein AKAW2_10544A [Aspergillus luchuensis]|uniref:Uncharacterized protein n=1 Tax=Aspergillus kawachii TaxID=1069201 RepID=A0A7R7ZUG1_ASPKA|nr:uncharacterized protein AKAW2_10544A [Aspergillus luchuensis]BCR93497.1 hypothetical protein AKAW2_10544A [Aspergillus luchuensis]
MVHSCTTRSILEDELKVGACAPSSMGGLNIKLIQAKGLQLSRGSVVVTASCGFDDSTNAREARWGNVFSLEAHALLGYRYASISQSARNSIPGLDYTSGSITSFAHARRFLCMFSTFCCSCWSVGGLDSALRIALMGHSPHRLFVQLSWVCSL